MCNDKNISIFEPAGIPNIELETCVQSNMKCSIIAFYHLMLLCAVSVGIPAGTVLLVLSADDSLVCL